MRRVLTRVLASIAGLSMGAFLTGDHAEHKQNTSHLPHELRVAIDAHYPPYSFLSADGEIRGLSPDLWRLWGQHNNVAIRFIQVPFRQGQAELAMLNSADVFDQLPISRVTQSRYFFGEPYAKLELAIYYRPEAGNPPSLKKRAAMKIGVVADGACHELLKQAAHRDFVLFDSYLDLQHAVVTDSVQAFCTYTDTAHWLFSGYLLGGYRRTVPLYALDMHWGVPRHKENLYHAVKEGFNKITPAERVSLYTRWSDGELEDIQQRNLVIFYAVALTLLLACLALYNVTLRKRLREVSALRVKAEKGAASEQARLRDALAAVNDVILEIAHDGLCLSSNAVRSPLVTDTDGHVGRHYHEFLTKPTAAFLESALDCLKRGLCSTRVFSIEHGPSTRWYELRLSATASIEPARYVAVIEDITLRRRAELNTRMVSRAFRLVSICNLLLFKAKSQERLLFAVCNLLCQAGPYTLVWVGEAMNDDNRSIKPLAWSGPESEYLETTQFSWSEASPMGNGPAGRAIRSGHLARSSDSSESHLKAWRTDYIEHGFRVNMAFPLTIGDKTKGCLCLYADSLDAFNEDETTLLEALVENMMYGLRTLESRQLHSEAQQVAKAQGHYLNELQERLKGPLNTIEGRLRVLASAESDADKHQKLTEILSSTKDLTDIIESSHEGMAERTTRP